MTESRSPLPALLAGMLEAGINRVLDLDPASGERFGRLAGKSLQVDIEGIGISFFLGFEYGSVQVATQADREPDTRVSGTPTALFAMAAPEGLGDWGLPGSGVRVEGDAGLARDLGRVFRELDLDWQEPLTRLFGDALGFQLASGLRQAAATLRRAGQVGAEQTADYLRSGQGPVVGREEIDHFNAGVDELREAVDRLEARLRARGRQDP